VKENPSRDLLAFRIETGDSEPMDEQTNAPAATLHRWLTGPRFSMLPIRSARPPRAETFLRVFSAREPKRWNSSFGRVSKRLAPLAPHFVSVTYGAGGNHSGADPCHCRTDRAGDEPGARRSPDLRRCDAARGE